MVTRQALCAGAALLWSTAAFAQMQHQHAAPAQARCTEPSLACAGVATPAFAADGSLWLIWAAAGQVSAAHSQDLGRSFGPAVAVTPRQVRLDTGPDSRPKIVIDPKGRIVVTYTIFKDDRFNGQVFFARSTDGGRSFDPPQPLTASDASQRFDALAVDASGAVFAAWLDKREVAAARQAGQSYAGAALAFAWSDDGGHSFTSAKLAHSNTCECCRLGVAFAGPGRPAVLWRNIFGETTRDHAVMTFADRWTPGPVQRVSVDDWEIDVCPHHGPSLAVTPGGTYHAAWFTEGRNRQGLFYARSTDGGRSFTDPRPLGDADRQPSRPQVLAVGGVVWLAWKEFDGEHSSVMAQASHDDGQSWSAARRVAETADASDHPLLIGDRGRAFLSWQTQVDGYRLLPLEDKP